MMSRVAKSGVIPTASIDMSGWPSSILHLWQVWTKDGLCRCGVGMMRDGLQAPACHRYDRGGT